jgi:transposase
MDDDGVLRLMEIRGIDDCSALLSWVDDIRRFSNWRMLASYASVVPGRSDASL